MKFKKKTPTVIRRWGQKRLTIPGLLNTEVERWIIPNLCSGGVA